MKVLKKVAWLLWISLLGVTLAVMPVSAKTFVYVSCANDGEIAVMEMNLETGDLEMRGKTQAGKVVMPMAVSPDRRYLYAAIRSVPYLYASYAIDSTKGDLTLLSKVPSPDNQVYISTDRTGRFLLGASYAGHKISVNPIGDKGLVQAEATQVMSTDRHPHSILSDPSNRFVFVPNLGVDQVMQMKFDEKIGVLASNEPAVIKTKAGAGPRHFTFSPNNKFVYVLTELTGMVNAYTFDSGTGLLKEIQSISVVPRNLNLKPGKIGAPLGGAKPVGVDTKPEEDIATADIHITPDGKFLYASERTSSTLAAFAVDSATGKLTYINNYATETQPRGFNIDPRGNFLLCAGQKSGHVRVHKINQETGVLQQLNRISVGNNPNWIEIVDFP